MRIVPAIMSGGAGTRLWPLSTEAKPKQFHALAGERSLFAETAARLSGVTGALSFAPPIVLCGEAHVAPAQAALAEAGVTASAIVIEPAARNTAAVAAVAAAAAREVEPNALVLLAPADHVIADTPAFHTAIARAAAFAHERIVTFGMAATRPATGYGYIRSGRELGQGVFEIDAFKEKPDAKLAEEYVASGAYTWNSGMFLFDPKVLLDEFATNPAIRDGALESLAAATRAANQIRLGGAYAAAPALPLDIAVMEHTKRGAVAPCDIGWADIGSWDEVWRLASHDSDGNAKHGAVATLDANNNLLRAEGVKLCVAGVEDLVVIATPEAVIVLPRARAQDAKLLRELAEKPN